ncbi:MAG: hypothetical protein TR69_WS6001000487 [candidate division WS6 bacterium OLB20]|uniref:Lipoprotein n=1 Tax=candidate division WS6 bacterium OLB20 TaxID=1617426 RepID=A0A136LXV8_9BACT|nr:MAG: hypothetical protein TR69_WS6001000487 [candidate division WS6 bacterium OLB20]
MKKFASVLALIALAACTPVMVDNEPSPTPVPSEYAEPTRPPYDVKTTFTDEERGISVEFSYGNGRYYYYGTVTTPTPCHKVLVDTRIAESFPEQVTMDVTVEATDAVCAQVIAEQVFSGEIQVSEQASLTLLFEGTEVSRETN